MRKAITLPLLPRPIGLLWPLLGANLALAVSLSLHGFPAAAVRALQLFLRF
jgi:hypothetical protein